MNTTTPEKKDLKTRLNAAISNTCEKEVDKLDEEIDKEIDRLLKGIEDASDPLKTSDVEKAIEKIKQRRGSLFVKSSFESEVVGISKNILAFGSAGLALAAANISKLSELPPIWREGLLALGVFYMELVVASLIVLFLYIWQARFRFPFLYTKRLGNTWPYYYYAAVDEKTPRPLLQTTPLRLKGMIYYFKDFLTYTEKFVDEKPHGVLRSELQQLFLLVSYQGYVNQFHIRLTKVFVYTWSSISLSFLILVVILIARNL